MTDYGRDVATLWTSAGPDLDPYGRVITGPEAVAHAVARRRVTPTGALSWDPTAGFDVRSLLGDAVDAGALLNIQTGIDREAEKDERVARAETTLTFDAASSRLRIDLALELADGPTFSLVLSVDSVSVQLLSIG